MQPILFLDFDGTLCFDKYWRSLPAEQFQKVQELVFGQDRSLLTEWMVGKRTAEEVNMIVAKSLGVEYEQLWKLFVHDCETMHVSDQTLATIAGLREKYVTILVTANMDSFTRFTVPALNLESVFQYINNSFDTGKFKADDNGALFLSYINALNAPVSACVLIDDSPRNCELFTTLGGMACQIDAGRNVDYYLAQLQAP